MSDADELVDALQPFLTGGSSNTDPAASLGGATSSTRIRGMGALVTSPIPAIRIDNVFPASGEGDGEIGINADGDITYTPPGDTEGDPVTIADGESKIVAGADESKAVRVYREAGLPFTFAPMTFGLVYPLNGVFGMASLTSAQRVAGRTTYRAINLAAVGSHGVLNLRLWLPAVGGAQAVYSLALETPSGGSIQTIANETTAPTGLSWSTPTSEGAALTVTSIAYGASRGLWIRRVFPPAGTVSARENVQLAMKFLGADD